jgi:Protein of unknown function (DUF1559)
MQVDERFAGQTGPCASCGETITIGGSSSVTPTAGQSSGSGSSIGWVIGLVASVVAAFGCLALLGAALLLPAISSARTSARNAQSANNLKQIAIALHNYHDVYQSFPPAYVADSEGKPLYSWRVLILPFLEQTPLYEQFDKTKAWDAPENLAISGMMISTFKSPNSTAPTLNGTNYYCVIGPRTIFPGSTGTNMASIRDGTSNTLMILESEEISATSWAAPIEFDITKQPLMFGTGVGQIQPIQPGGIHVMLADGSVRFMPIAQANALLPAMIDRADGQVIPNF